jgi:hypothetical protein
MARLRWNYVSEIQRVCKKNSLQSHLICLIFLLKLSEIALCIVIYCVLELILYSWNPIVILSDCCAL